MSRSHRNSPWKCSCCGESAAKRKDEQAPRLCDEPYTPPGTCWCCADEPGPTAQDLEYDKIEQDYWKWIEEQELDEMARAE